MTMLHSLIASESGGHTHFPGAAPEIMLIPVSRATSLWVLIAATACLAAWFAQREVPQERWLWFWRWHGAVILGLFASLGLVLWNSLADPTPADPYFFVGAAAAIGIQIFSLVLKAVPSRGRSWSGGVRHGG